MQTLKIDVKKIDKTALFHGEKGTYLDLTLMDNRDGTDQYGYDGFIVQSISKERRLAGEKGPILGNWKHLGERAPIYQGQAATSLAPVSQSLASNDDDDIPF